MFCRPRLARTQPLFHLGTRAILFWFQVVQHHTDCTIRHARRLPEPYSHAPRRFLSLPCKPCRFAASYKLPAHNHGESWRSSGTDGYHSSLSCTTEPAFPPSCRWSTYSHPCRPCTTPSRLTFRGCNQASQPLRVQRSPPTPPWPLRSPWPPTPSPNPASLVSSWKSPLCSVLALLRRFLLPGAKVHAYRAMGITRFLLPTSVRGWSAFCSSVHPSV